MLVSYNLGSKRATSELIKENEKTVIVKAPNGKGTIKRHKAKHDVIKEEATK